jgi:signal transduction histidine kinase
VADLATRIGTNVRRMSALVAELQDTHPTREIDATISTPIALSCDRSLVQQLLSNLLANALTHGAQDRKVEMSAQIVGEELQIAVLSQGEPVPPASIEKIFAPFWRRSSAAQREGLGLGLHISEQIAKAHGGSIRVASSAESGTRFTAVLPLAGPVPAADAA